jgi:hypothetical protein
MILLGLSLEKDRFTAFVRHHPLASINNPTECGLLKERLQPSLDYCFCRLDTLIGPV